MVVPLYAFVMIQQIIRYVKIHKGKKERKGNRIAFQVRNAPISPRLFVSVSDSSQIQEVLDPEGCAIADIPADRRQECHK